MSWLPHIHFLEAAEDRIALCEEYLAQRHPTLRHEQVALLQCLPSLRRISPHQTLERALIDVEILTGPFGIDLITAQVSKPGSKWVRQREAARYKAMSWEDTTIVWEIFNGYPPTKVIRAADHLRSTGWRGWLVKNDVHYHQLAANAVQSTSIWSSYVKDYMARSDPQYAQMAELVPLARAFLRFPDCALLGNMFHIAYTDMRYQIDEDSHNIPLILRRDRKFYLIESWGPEIDVFRDLASEDFDTNVDMDEMYRVPRDEQNCIIYGDLPPMPTINVSPVMCDAEAFETESVAGDADEEKRCFYEKSEWRDDAGIDWL